MADRPTAAQRPIDVDTAAAPAVHWEWEAFRTLRNEALYAALALRAIVFVVEQECPFLDLDGYDLEAHHLLGWATREVQADAALIAYLRVLPPGAKFAEPSIGRVITAQARRGAGLGRTLMVEGMRRTQALYQGSPIRISAQQRLQAFYESLGFERVSPSFVEDGIPHVEMLLPANAPIPEGPARVART